MAEFVNVAQLGKGELLHRLLSVEADLQRCKNTIDSIDDELASSLSELSRCSFYLFLFTIVFPGVTKPALSIMKKWLGEEEIDRFTLAKETNERGRIQTAFILKSMEP
eukprot:scaffold10306_cov89-Cylindrotheca_fusiformis.AAC.1